MNFCRPATLDTAAGRYYTRLTAQGRKSVYTRVRTHSTLSVPEFINEKRYHCTIKGTLNNALKGAHFFLLQALDGTRAYNTKFFLSWPHYCAGLWFDQLFKCIRRRFFPIIRFTLI